MTSIHELRPVARLLRYKDRETKRDILLNSAPGKLMEPLVLDDVGRLAVALYSAPVAPDPAA